MLRVSRNSAQWQSALAVAGHSGQSCDMAPLNDTRRAEEPMILHARSPVTPGTFATRFRWSRSVAVYRVQQTSLVTACTDARNIFLCDVLRPRCWWLGLGVRIMALERTYGDERNCDTVRLSQSFVWKSDFIFFRVISLIFCVKRLASLTLCSDVIATAMLVVKAIALYALVICDHVRLAHFWQLLLRVIQLTPKWGRPKYYDIICIRSIGRGFGDQHLTASLCAPDSLITKVSLYPCCCPKCI